MRLLGVALLAPQPALWQELVRILEVRLIPTRSVVVHHTHRLQEENTTMTSLHSQKTNEMLRQSTIMRVSVSAAGTHSSSCAVEVGQATRDVTRSGVKVVYKESGDAIEFRVARDCGSI